MMKPESLAVLTKQSNRNHGGSKVEVNRTKNGQGTKPSHGSSTLSKKPSRPKMI